jgi:hypothetical protein
MYARKWLGKMVSIAVVTRAPGAWEKEVSTGRWDVEHSYKSMWGPRPTMRRYSLGVLTEREVDEMDEATAGRWRG